MNQIDESQFGAVWWAGEYECRNDKGWFRSRYGGEGNWLFQVYGFGSDEKTCSVYRVAEDGKLKLEDVPIDEQEQIVIDGKPYGRDFWNH